jgi:hypothetical protein
MLGVTQCNYTHLYPQHTDNYVLPPSYVFPPPPVTAAPAPTVLEGGITKLKALAEGPGVLLDSLALTGREALAVLAALEDKATVRDLKKQLAEAQEQVVWCFSEAEKPVYYQGKKGAHGINKPVTAEDVTNLVEPLDQSRLAAAYWERLNQIFCTPDKFGIIAEGCAVGASVRQAKISVDEGNPPPERCSQKPVWGYREAQVVPVVTLNNLRKDAVRFRRARELGYLTASDVAGIDGEPPACPMPSNEDTKLTAIRSIVGQGCGITAQKARFLIERIDALSQSAGRVDLIWTTAQPTVPGWYWLQFGEGDSHMARIYRDLVGPDTAALRVAVGNSDNYLDKYSGHQKWAGPLSPP